MSKVIILGSIVFLMLLSAGCNSAKTDVHAHEHHEGHHHGEDEKSHGHHHKDDHDGEISNHHHHEEEGNVEIHPQFMEMAGITLAKPDTGRIKFTLDASGEVGFNEDYLVHITPRYSGVVKEVKYTVGEYVKAGSTVAVIESNQSLTQYSLKAPISGRVIQKHAVPGEHVSEEESIYVLADLSTVWVNLAVYPKDIEKVKTGQKVVITETGTDNSTVGRIQYITPVMDVQTRRVMARVVLPNDNNRWRPGSFINARIDLGGGERGLIISKDAVQILDNKNVVFVQHKPNIFKPVTVVTGEKDSQNIRILSGLEPDVKYVNKGAFELKAEIVTSSLGDHAGHGH